MKYRAYVSKVEIDWIDFECDEDVDVNEVAEELCRKGFTMDYTFDEVVPLDE